MKCLKLSVFWILRWIVICVLVKKGSVRALPNDFKERLSTDFRSKCPRTETCKAPVNNITYYDNIYEFIFPSITDPLSLEGINCCDECSCHSDCGYSCCPDAGTRNLHIDLATLKRRQCVQAAFNDWNDTTNRYEMFAECPEGYKNAVVAERCSRNYKDFNFNEPRHYFVPVTEASTNIIFKNCYCADCNGAENKTQALLNWNMEVSCDEKQVWFADFKSIPEVLLERPDCKLTFTPPGNIEDRHLYLCSNLITKCNETGRWQQYEEFLEQACLSYKSVYDRSFKNVHCYLCNQETLDETNDLCIPLVKDKIIHQSSFISLLDFNELEKNTIRGEDSRCQHGEVFDGTRNTCVELVCSQGLILQLGTSENDHQCIPFLGYLGSAANLSIQVQISFIILKHLDEPGVQTNKIVDLIERFVSEKTELMAYKPFIDALDVYIVSDFEYLELSTSSNENVSWANIDHVHVSTKLNVDLPFNEATLYLKLLSLLFTAETDVLGDFQIVYTDTNLLKDIKTRLHSVQNDKMNQHQTHAFTSRIGSFFPEIYSSGDNKTVVIQLQRTVYFQQLLFTSVPMTLWPNPSCPRVKVDIHEVISDAGNLVDDIEDEVVVSSMNGVRFNDAAKVLICVRYYRSLHDPTTKIENVRELTQILFSNLTYVCLSVSIVCLMCTLVIYFLCSQLHNLPGFNNIALISSLIIFYIVALISLIKSPSNKVACEIIGGSLHFFQMLSVFWMLISCINVVRSFAFLQSFNSNMNIKRRFAVYNVCAIVMALTVNGVVVVYSLVVTSGTDVGYGGVPCFIKEANLVLFTVAVPIAVVVLFNVSMLLFVGIVLCRAPSVPSNRQNDINRIKVMVKLSTLSGSSWLFGHLYQLTDQDIFGYLFIVLTAAQGVFLFVSFACNHRVRSMVMERFGTKRFSQTQMSNQTELQVR